MQLAASAKAQFSGREYSDHLALVRAYDGWKDAEAQRAGYDYCWRNFLSFQTLKAIDSLRKQFSYLLKDIGLVDSNSAAFNKWSHEEHLLRTVICAGLFPGISSVVVIHSTCPFHSCGTSVLVFTFSLFFAPAVSIHVCISTSA